MSESESARSLKRYQELFDFAPLAYLQVTATGRICQANRSAATLLGREHVHLRGVCVREFLDEAGQRAFGELMTELFAVETTQSTEVRLLSGERAPRVVVLTGSLAPGASEAFLAIVDVTEQHRMAAELSATDNYYRRIVETTSEGIVITDPVAGIKFVNARLAAILGYGREELIDRSGFMLVEPEDRATTEERIARRRAGRNVSTSLRHRVSKFTEAKCCLTAAKEARLRVLRVG